MKFSEDLGTKGVERKERWVSKERDHTSWHCLSHHTCLVPSYFTLKISLHHKAIRTTNLINDNLTTAHPNFLTCLLRSTPYPFHITQQVSDLTERMIRKKKDIANLKLKSHLNQTSTEPHIELRHTHRFSKCHRRAAWRGMYVRGAEEITFSHENTDSMMRINAN